MLYEIEVKGCNNLVLKKNIVIRLIVLCMLNKFKLLFYTYVFIHKMCIVLKKRNSNQKSSLDISNQLTFI